VLSWRFFSYGQLFIRLACSLGRLGRKTKMDDVIFLGYSVRITNVIAFGAFAVAFAALVVSIIALRLNRNSLSLSEGRDYVGGVLYVTNNSPHAVTISAFGYLGPDGCSSSLIDDSYIKLRVDPRDECTITISDDMSSIVRAAKGTYKWHCLYVTLATDHTFYSASWRRRWVAWILGWINGARRRRRLKSEL